MPKNVNCVSGQEGEATSDEGSRASGATSDDGATTTSKFKPLQMLSGALLVMVSRVHGSSRRSKEVLMLSPAPASRWVAWSSATSRQQPLSFLQICRLN